MLRIIAVLVLATTALAPMGDTPGEQSSSLTAEIEGVDETRHSNFGDPDVWCRWDVVVSGGTPPYRYEWLDSNAQGHTWPFFEERQPDTPAGWTEIWVTVYDDNDDWKRATKWDYISSTAEVDELYCWEDWG